MENIFEIKEKITSKKVVNKKTIYSYCLLLKCKTCGHEIKITSSDLKNTNIRGCKMCKLYIDKSTFIGYENKNFKVLDVDETKKVKNKRFYLVQCKHCNQVISMRKDSIIDSRHTCCIKCKGNGKTPGLLGVLNSYRSIYYTGAINRGFVWDLTDSEFVKLTQQDCYYCGAPPRDIQSLKRYNRTKDIFKANGIDRKNSLEGYTAHNSVPCCSVCNLMKMTLSDIDFINQATLIHKNFIKRSTTIPEGSTLQVNGSGSGGDLEIDHDIVCSLQ